VAALALQAEHHPGQVFRLYLATVPHLADFGVLAELAAKVAPGKKDRPRTTSAYQGVFLAEVGANTRDDGPLGRAAARALGAFAPVDTALAGADVARLQAGVGFRHASFQLA
jgi:hypothetical protein